MKIKVGILIDVVSIFILYLSGIKFEVANSFLLILLAINFLYFYLVRKESTTSIVSCSLLVFTYLFFYIAPIIQLGRAEYSELINTFPISESLIFNGNLLISISILTYCMVYRIIDKKHIYLFNTRPINLEGINSKDLLKISILLMMPFILINAYELVKFFLGDHGAYQGYKSVTVLLLTKFFFIIPISIAAFFIEIYGIKKHYQLLIPILLLAIFFKNPFIENRSGFGIAFLFLFFIMANNRIGSNARILSLLVISMTILFPLGEILSIYRNYHISSYDKLAGIFNTVHYDAWANGIATIDMVNKNGFMDGNQIIGSLLFFIPRNYWVTKPNASGQLLGEYMVDNYHHWMTNISMPYVFEGYLDFGLLGVLIFSVILAISSYILDLGYISKNIFIKIISIYISVSTIFILRGPLLSSFAYTFGGIVSLTLTFWLIWFYAKKISNKSFGVN